MAFCIAFNGSQNDSWIQFLNTFPGKAHTVQCTRSEVFDHNVGFFDHLFQKFFAFRSFHVQFNRTFVTVEHREIQGVNVWFVLQPSTSHISGTTSFNLDDVCAQETHHLCTGRTCLDVGEVKHIKSV